MEYVNQHPESQNIWLNNQLHRLRVNFHCPSLTINGSSCEPVRPTSGATFRAHPTPTPTTCRLTQPEYRPHKRFETSSAPDRHAYWHGKCLKVLRHYEHGLLLQVSELVEQLQTFANKKWGEPTIQSVLNILQADNKRFDVSFSPTWARLWSKHSPPQTGMDRAHGLLPLLPTLLLTGKEHGKIAGNRHRPGTPMGGVRNTKHTWQPRPSDQTRHHLISEHTTFSGRSTLPSCSILH